MAVYEHTYRGYDGRITPAWSRFLVLPRYAFERLFGSRVFLAFFLLCFVWPAILIVALYLRHNAEALAVLQAMGIDVDKALAVDGWAVLNLFVRPQGSLAFILALVVGPALISPDLRNNGMALYLSRPFARWEYVLGKLSVVAILLSAVTWVPGLALLGFNALLEGGGWIGEYGWTAAALFMASWVWILMLTFLALALSAWVKWKPLARLLFLGLFFVLYTFSVVLNLLYRTEWGNLIDLWALRDTLWSSLFRQEVSTSLTAAAAWAAVAAILALCLLLLSRKVRAYEVER